MLKILPTESKRGLSCQVFFERTETMRDRIIDCTREELIDLSFYLLDAFEKTYGNLEKEKESIENILGYTEPWLLPTNNE